jgi:hypothetical protein
MIWVPEQQISLLRNPDHGNWGGVAVARRGARGTEPVRRESSTVGVLVGWVTGGLLAALAQSPNVSVARAPAAENGKPPAEPGAGQRPGWRPEAWPFARPRGGSSTYVVVPDPVTFR